MESASAGYIDVSDIILIITSPECTLGDHVFLAAAAHAWHSLPSFVRDEQSLATL